MKYISLNWTLALKFSIGKKKRMRDCRILMAHDCTLYSVQCIDSKENIGIFVSSFTLVEYSLSDFNANTETRFIGIRHF